MRLSGLVSLFSVAASAPAALDSAARRGDSGCPPLPRRHASGIVAALAAGREERRLADARDRFADALDDLRSADALDLKSRIATTRSLPELWNCREHVFGLVACARDQREAQRRLAALDRHFGG